jgi:lactate dehydrogenase-like 2-hydroxyacid dehydrogenase
VSIDLLLNLELPEYCIRHLSEKYTVHYWPDEEDHPRLLGDPILREIRAVQTNGSYGLKRPFIEAMPKLEIICAIGAGSKGSISTRRANAASSWRMAPARTRRASRDQAFALLLGAMRRLPWCDQGIRAGRWTEVRTATPIPTGKKLGILGLGHVGMAIARRARGFDMEIGYHNRRERADADYRYFTSLEALAGWSDVLAVATPGGPATRGMVGADILEALGPDGYLINVGRGSVVDSTALADALAARRIAGAGLDVLDGEPEVPAAFMGLDRLVMSPHVGGLAPESMRNMIHHARDNFDAHFAGKPVSTPVPE